MANYTNFTQNAHKFLCETTFYTKWITRMPCSSFK
jgi:hypothetical protein